MSIGPEAPGGITGSLPIIWVARGMLKAEITKITKAEMAQKHVGVLLQQVVLSDMLDCCCWPGN